MLLSEKPSIFKVPFDRILRRQAMHEEMAANVTLMVVLKLITRKYGVGYDVYKIVRSFVVTHNSPRKSDRTAHTWLQG